jgi:signal transduction histidine kinase
MNLPLAVQAVVDAAVDPTVVVDPELGVVRFNRPYLQLTGLRERDLRKRELKAMCHTHFGLELCAAEGGCLASRALKARKPLRMDQVQGLGGALRLVITAVPLSGDDGSPYAVMEVYRDVTAETRMQENYKDLLGRERRQNEILQEEVNKRTLQLQQSLDELKSARTQLIQSEKMSSLGLLVAGIAHELNNPINFIYANVDFLEEHLGTYEKLLREAEWLVSSDPALKQRLAAKGEELGLSLAREDLPGIVSGMRGGAERVSAIIGDLRVFSHGGTTDYRDYDVNQGITMTLRLVKQEARGRVELVPDLGQVAPLKCNGTQLNQVLMNLVVNAIQAIPEQGTVWVRSRERGEQVVVEVQDTGPGIAPEVLEKIFDPFFTTKEVGKGTGLGLSISQRIVAAHQGKLEVETELGRGSTFRVILPRLTQRPSSNPPR